MIIEDKEGGCRYFVRCDECDARERVLVPTIGDLKQLLRKDGWSFGPGQTLKGVLCPTHADPGYDGECRDVDEVSCYRQGCSAKVGSERIAEELGWLLMLPLGKKFWVCPRHLDRDQVAKDVVSYMQSPEGQAESNEAIRQAIHRGQCTYRCVVTKCTRETHDLEKALVDGWVMRSRGDQHDLLCPDHVKEGFSFEPAAEYEYVDHPAHYGGADDPYEVIKVIEAWDLGFHLGSAVRYIGRLGKKPGEEALRELKKARWYIDREIARRSR